LSNAYAGNENLQRLLSKLDNSALRFEDKVIFKMAAVRHLEFAKFPLFVK